MAGNRAKPTNSIRFSRSRYYVLRQTREIAHRNPQGVEGRVNSQLSWNRRSGDGVRQTRCDWSAVRITTQQVPRSGCLVSKDGREAGLRSRQTDRLEGFVVQSCPLLSLSLEADKDEAEEAAAAVRLVGRRESEDGTG